MARATGIEWCDHTWSPWIGCTRISAACDHCYAATYGHRFGVEFETGAPRRRTSAEYWKQPLRWNRQAAAAGQPATVFPSLCDPFDSEVDPAWLGDMLALFEPLKALRLLLLTKRPHLAAKYFAGRPAPDNVALGATVEDQKMADLRIPQLLSIGARWKFLSCEPLLGLVDLFDIPWPEGRPTFPETDDISDGRSSLHIVEGTRIDWVIAGGESGPKARPSHPDWFRELRDQCRAAGVPFFFKQWGEHGPGPKFTADLSSRERYRGEIQTLQQPGKPDVMLCIPTRDDDRLGPPLTLYRYGKKLAGAALDGREWREMPQW